MPKSNVIICDKNTGNVLYWVHGSVEGTQLPEHQVAIVAPGIDPTGYFYNDDLEKLEPKKTFSPGEFNGRYYEIALPDECLAIWQGQSYVVDDGLLEVLVDQPGEFSLFLFHPHYKSAVFKIENQSLS